MMDSDTIRFIKEEILKQVNIILYAQSGENSSVQNEDIEQIYRGSGTIVNRPVMHPYGMSSRAPAKTISVTGKVGDHPGNRVVLGHRDKDRPIDLEEGETVLYNGENFQVRLGKKTMRMGHTTDGTDAGFAGESYIGITKDAILGDTIIIQHKDGASLELSPNGSMNLASKDGSYLFFNAVLGEVSLVSKDGNVLGMGKGGITFTDLSGKQIISMDPIRGQIQLLGSNNVVISGGIVTIGGGTINLGAGATFSGVMGEQLEAYLDSHTHNIITPAPGSLTTPPTILSSVYNLNPALSFKALFVRMRSNIV